MKKPNIFKIIKNWILQLIAGVSFKIFLWATETTQEKYWQDIYNQEKFFVEHGDGLNKIDYDLYK